MSWTRYFRREKWNDERARELAAHAQIEADENISRGMPPDEARYAAIRTLGNSLQVREEIYRMNSVGFVETLWQDVRQSLRSLWKNPRFTAIATLTLALGIGANTAAFSMVNALLLHPYSFANLDRLVLVWESRGGEVSSDARRIAPADAIDIGDSKVFEELAMYREQSFNLSADGNVEPVFGCGVSADFFRMLGVAPEMGRTLGEEEQQPGSDAVIVVSHGFWERRLGADPAALGKEVQLNGRKYSVIGIMAKDFNYPQAMELWVPLALSPSEKADRTQLSLIALGKLRPGISVPEARAALDGISRQLQKQFPRTNSARISDLLELRKELYFFTLPLFLLLQAAAVFVLLLACANLASVLFARMIGRQREIAIRAALGAGRRRLTQLYVCETLLLALGAGILAAAISSWSVNVLRTSIPSGWTEWVPGWDGIHVNSTVLLFTIFLSVMVGICCGFATVLHTGRVELNKTLKEAGPGAMTKSKERLRSSLVVTQVTFALVLLVCAGLTIQGFRRLANLYADRQPENVLKVRISLPKNSYPTTARVASFYQQLLRESSALPGVSSAALITNAPASNVDNQTSQFTIEGRPPLSANEAPEADLQIASPEYFRALRISMIRGRAFSDSDDANTRQVVVISRSMATTYWPDGNELGHRLKLGPPESAEPWLTVVGVVEDVRQNWWNPPARPTIYQPFFQAPKTSMVFLLRTSSAPTSYASVVRNVVKQIDPGIALSSLDGYENEVSTSIAIIRILGILLGVFGLIALTLSSIGIYGVILESVVQRTREIGIRVALGATPRDVLRIVVWRSLRLTGIGVAIGLPLSFFANRAMAKLVLGIVTIDPTMLAGVAILLAAVGAMAGYFPARRAMRVNPIVALRYE